MKSEALYKVPIGSRLLMEGIAWRVISFDQDGYSVESVDGDDFVQFSVDEVQRAIASNRCEVLKPAHLKKLEALRRYTGGFESVDQLPQDEQENIRVRLALVLAAIQLETDGYKITQRFLDRTDIQEKLKHIACELAENDRLFGGARGGQSYSAFKLPGGRTLKEWVDRYLRFNREAIVLMHRHHLKGPPEELRSRLNQYQEQFINYVLNLMMNGSKTELAPLFRTAQRQFHVCERARLLGFSFPSIVTVRTRFKQIDNLVKEVGREGKRATKNTYGAGSTDVRALFFGEKLAMDQCYLSIFVNGKGEIEVCEIDPKTEEEAQAENEITRVWLHFGLDVATRMPLGWQLSDSADSESAMAVLRMAMRDKSKEKVRYQCQSDPAPAVGLMQTLADNGTATRNRALFAAQLGAGTAVETNRAYISTDNSFVERAFGTVQFQLLNFLKGYTGSRPGELPAADPMADAEWSRQQLLGQITRYFIDEYPHQSHRGTGMFGATPKQKLRETLKIYGQIDPPSPENRRLHLGIKRTCTTTSEGVRVLGIPFNSTALQKFHDGEPKEVTAYIDPDYIQRVSVVVEGLPEIIHAELSMTAFADLTLSEALELMKSKVKQDPHLKRLDDEILMKANKRRGTESGFFPDSRDPSNCNKIAALEKQAEAIAKVEVRPSFAPGYVTPPGSVSSYQTKHNRSVRPESSQLSQEEPTLPSSAKASQSKSFTQLKKSKL